MSDMNRRGFVRQTASALTGLATLSAWGSQTVFGANERLQLATIGLKNQGYSDTRSFLETGKADFIAFCDVDQKILDEKRSDIQKRHHQDPKPYHDFRQVLDDKNVEAVIIGTPDHWHANIALLACEAGKDVYIEKPCAHNVNECRLIAQAAKKHNRIIQHGTQQRSGKHFQEAKEYVQSGKLGKIALVRTWGILGRESISKAPVEEPPAYLDYDFWLGPAPKKSYTKNRCHYNWRFMWDYGTGDMGNWGVHWIDIALWALDLGWPLSVSSTGGMFVFEDDKETPDTQITVYEYPNLTLLWELRMWSKQPMEKRGVGTAFYGDQQTLIVDRGGFEVFSQDGKELILSVKPSNDMSKTHAEDFIDSVRNRKAPIADIEHGHIPAAVSILGNVAYHAGVKIRYDAEKNKLQHEEFNHLLTREYRDDWKLPLA